MINNLIVKNNKVYIVDKNNNICSKGYDYIKINKNNNYIIVYNNMEIDDILQKHETIIEKHGAILKYNKDTNFYDQITDWIFEIEDIEFLNIDKTKLFLVTFKTLIEKPNKFIRFIRKINFLKKYNNKKFNTKQVICKLDFSYLGYHISSPYFDKIKFSESLLKYGDYYIGKNNNLEQIFRTDSQIPISKKFSKIYTYGLLDGTSPFYIVQNKNNLLKTAYSINNNYKKLIPYSLSVYNKGAICGKSTKIYYIDLKGNKRVLDLKKY